MVLYVRKRFMLICLRQLKFAKNSCQNLKNSCQNDSNSFGFFMLFKNKPQHIKNELDTTEYRKRMKYILLMP